MTVILYVILEIYLTLKAEQLAKLMTVGNYMFVGSDAKALEDILCSIL